MLYVYYCRIGNCRAIGDVVQWLGKVWVEVSIGRIKNQVKKYFTTLLELSN